MGTFNFNKTILKEEELETLNRCLKYLPKVKLNKFEMFIDVHKETAHLNSFEHKFDKKKTVCPPPNPYQTLRSDMAFEGNPIPNFWLWVPTKIHTRPLSKHADWQAKKRGD